MARYYRRWWYGDVDGTPAVGQRAVVYGPGEDNSDLATIYTDGTFTTELPNPLPIGADGWLEFFVPTASGVYTVYGGPERNGEEHVWNSGGSASNPVLTVNGEPPDGSGNVDVTAEDLGAIPEAIMAAKGDLLTATANDTPAILPAGAPGLFLTTNPAEPTGLEWVAGGGGGTGTVESVNDVLPDGDGNVELAPSDIGAADATLVLTAGTGLSGGGDLTASRTFDVDYGTTAGTAAQGNDSRITGAIQASIIAAKGDILGGSANDTPVVTPVGSDGQFLRAASGQTSGLQWATVTAGTVGADPAGSAAAAQAAAIAASDPVGSAAAAQAAAIAASDPVGSAAAAQAAAIAASLQKAQNLNDLPSKPTARTNLGLGGAAELNVGTSAGTVAAGDDSRITGAIQGTLFAAKGDLIGASANDTPVIVPVGSNGRILTANSGVTPGVEWAAPNAETLIFSDDRAVLTVVAGSARWYNRQGYTMEILSAWASAGVVPTGADIIVDVNKNGTTIFTTQGNRPTVPATTNGGASSAAPNVTSLAAGDYLTVDIDQIGSTIAGGYLTVGVIVRRAV